MPQLVRGVSVWLQNSPSGEESAVIKTCHNRVDPTLLQSGVQQLPERLGE